MDMWSDPNLWPYMAVTAHWMQVKVEEHPSGPQHTLVLRSDLIGFHRMPTRHTGEHLAIGFLHILDRIDVTSKVSHYISFSISS